MKLFGRFESELVEIHNTSSVGFERSRSGSLLLWRPLRDVIDTRGVLFSVWIRRGTVTVLSPCFLPFVVP